MHRQLRLLKAAGYLPLFCVCILLAAYLWEFPLVLAACLAAISVVVLRVWGSSPDKTIYALGAVLGSVGEFVAIGGGAWQYAEPWFRIPIWLPFAWGIAALYLFRSAQAIGGWRVSAPAQMRQGGGSTICREPEQRRQSTLRTGKADATPRRVRGGQMRRTLR